MDDFPVILNIYATARAFMAKTGNPTQWADGHPSADLLRECILAQKLFVFTDPDDFSQIRGCFYFAIENDPTYAQISEGSWLSDAPYGVIHMVASDGQVHGFLRNVLDFCEPQTSHLRIDTHHDNKIMQHVLEKNGFRIALLNYTYGTNGIYVTPPNIINYIDTAIIAKDIETSKVMKPDVIIACMHWGIEYQSLPDKEQKFLADWLIRKGVNHVIGSHPHVVQPIEVREDSVTNDKNLVVYSLGNYISNMSARHTDGGLMVKMELVKDSITRLNKCEYSLVWTARPTQSGKKNHQLLPVNLPTDSIPVNARNSLKIFVNDTRSLFSKYNRGIKEYTFYKKK